MISRRNPLHAKSYATRHARSYADKAISTSGDGSELLGFLGRPVAVLDVQPHHPQLLAGIGRAGVVALVRGVGADLGA